MRIRAVITAAVAASALALTAACTPTPEPPDDTTPANSVRSVFNFENLLHVAASGDGRYLVAEVYDDEGDDLLGRRILLADTSTGSVLELPEGGYAPEVSDDGNTVVYRRYDFTEGDSTVRLWNRNTGAVAALPHAGELATGSIDQVSLSAEGDLVAWTIESTCFSSSCFGETKYSNLFVWDRNTGVTTRITDHQGTTVAPGYTQIVDDFEVSADGSTVTYMWTDYQAPRGPEFTLAHWYRAGGSSVFAAGDGYGRQLSVSGDASVVAYQWLRFTDGDWDQPTMDVGVWGATPGWFDPTPDAGDFGNPVLSRDGERLYMSSGSVVDQFGANLYLDTAELWYVTTDDSTVVRRAEPGSVPVSEITGSGSELLFLRADPAVERAQPHAWSPT